MKNLIYALLLFPMCLMGQVKEATLLDNWDDETLVGSFAYDNTYNEIWGVVVNDREYAVIGSTAGTHFIDVTDPSVVSEVAFVAGAVQGGSIIHRDYHDYQGYLYAVADEGAASTLQIIDFGALPDSVEVVYDSQEFFFRSHNIFIDTSSARLYAAPAGTSQGFIRLRVLSLENPEAPTLLADYSDIQGNSLGGIHDLYVRDNIGYLNLGSSNGLMIADFTDPAAPVHLASMTTYEQQGYNHSGWLSEDGSTYYLADETHGKDIKAVDVSDLTDVQVVKTFNAESADNNSIPHNLIVRGDYLYASYYYDGLQVYDISNPTDPQRVLSYDTYSLPNNSSYKGAWGVFPYLPSGNILVSDMQTGLYVFKNVEESLVGTSDPDETLNDIQVSPQPFDTNISVRFTLTKAQTINITMLDPTGKVVQSLDRADLPKGEYQSSYVVRPDLPTGMYLLQIKGEHINGVYKMMKM